MKSSTKNIEMKTTWYYVDGEKDTRMQYKSQNKKAGLTLPGIMCISFLMSHTYPRMIREAPAMTTDLGVMDTF